ncbi:uncharacterized protein N7484_012015 [Penicillium longicatenatum]|uniref:uncharacterized protein n=1 Tax=Penicillium longicatenatum TaxID=1561947 RepID=UPI00254855C0|nr:uncharacterized protein N7484_012015 [Penicillium longicatenatum]KAJ5631915.1 hypothetical protein N7484_012015 [Penicillium longicatenatum]
MASAALRPERPPEFMIRRKPVSNPNLRQTAVAQNPTLAHTATSPAVVPSPSLYPPSYTELYGPAPHGSRPVSPIPRPRTAGATSPSVPTPTPSPTPVQKAYGEARHFLGGLINHPTESNKHVTILRHSHGLVFYRGNSTSVAISIFSDTPLPPDRTIWLQSKGWTGKTGMRAKAMLRLHDSWLDVTPTMPLHANQINPDDERAWQRDIKKFRKKAPARPRDTHILRETAVVRIPADGGDGYFQLVLCQGPKKKVIGNSPVFRVLSTSTSPSSLRGASLSTLPLEVGAMVVSLYARTAAQTVVSPAASAITAKVDPYRPSWLTQTAAQTAYSASGAQDRVGGIINGSTRSRQRDTVKEPHSVEFYNGVSPMELGPQPPFPMTFKARGQVLEPQSPNRIGGSPRLTLNKVPDWVPQQLRGYYFGWARFDSETSKESSTGGWYPAVLSVRTFNPLQAERVDMSQLAKLVVKLRLLDDVPLLSNKLEIRVMGYLRADIPPPTGKTSQELADAQAAATEAAMLADAYDESVVQNTLAGAAWAAEMQTLVEIPRPNTGWMDRTRDGCANMRTRGQKWVEQVPLHRLGVRSTTDDARERQIAVNGFYIVR